MTSPQRPQGRQEAAASDGGGPGSGATPVRLVRVASTGSTNADVAAALKVPGAARAWPHRSVLVTDHQAGGRGRAGRAWETPPGTALTASVVLRPGVPLVRWSWLSLLGGLAVARAIEGRTPLAVALKWPNDVIVAGAGSEVVPGWGTDRKVAGVLTEVVRVPDESGAAEVGAAVLGFGVNVHQRAEQLPVPWATSLAATGATDQARDLGALLQAVRDELDRLLDPWEAAGGDAARSGLAAAVRGSCATIGHEVTVTLPGSGELTGRATGIDDDGALLVAASGGAAVRVTVGDVGHVRAAGG